MRLLTAVGYAMLIMWMVIFFSAVSVFLEKKKQERVNEDRLHQALVDYLRESKEDVI